MSMVSKERLLFGEWLVRTGRADAEILRSALAIQNSEKSDTLRSSPRLLGQILLDDFQIFRSRIELNKCLVEFEKVKTAISARKDELKIREESFVPTKAKKASVGEKMSQAPIQKTTDRSLFGQFLIEQKKVNQVILDKALDIQNTESKDALRNSHRLLGEILLDDFNVFASRVELNRLLIEYNQFKSQLENQRTDLMFLTRRNDQ
jgi:hypothetical protein